jgi:hypothetical protein
MMEIAEVAPEVLVPLAVGVSSVRNYHRIGFW